MKRTSITALATLLLILAVWCLQAGAAEVKIAVMNMQKVLAESEAGKKAQATLEQKVKSLQASFKKEQDALVALEQEMKKKSSAWSEEIKQEKAIEYQKLGRELKNKQEDANLEMNKLREQQLAPILKELEGVVQETAKAKGYTLVLPNNAVLYNAGEVDITAEITKALNAKVK